MTAHRAGTPWMPLQPGAESGSFPHGPPQFLPPSKLECGPHLLSEVCPDHPALKESLSLSHYQSTWGCRSYSH